MDATEWKPSRPNLQAALAAMKRERKRNAALVEYADVLEAAYNSGSGCGVFEVLNDIFTPFKQEA